MRSIAFVTLAACALAQKSEPRELRYFTPEHAARAEELLADGQPRMALRLGRIVAAADLRLAIVHRDSPHELAMYDTLRWTEPPDIYARRALVRELFAHRAIDQVVGGRAPTLDLELVAFEELVHGERHAGRVELRYELHDEHRVLARDTISVTRWARGPDIEAVVTAIGAAMDAAAEAVADRVAQQLHETTPPRRNGVPDDTCSHDARALSLH